MKNSLRFGNKTLTNQHGRVESSNGIGQDFSESRCRGRDVGSSGTNEEVLQMSLKGRLIEEH